MGKINATANAMNGKLPLPETKNIEKSVEKPRKINRRRQIRGLSLLRIYAILMVVACHTGFLDSSSGGIGNKIFFVLGGCLSFFSLVGSDGDKSFSKKSISDYYIKRLVRIVPGYWLVIIVTAIVSSNFFVLSDFSTEKSLVLNLLFIKVYGHLWFMQQMMLMYIIAPLFIICLEIPRRGIFKNNHVVGCSVNFIVLITLAVLEKQYFTEEIFMLSGEGSHKQFQIWMFFIGIAVGYLCLMCKRVKIYSNINDIFFILFVAVSTITTIPILTEKGGDFITAFHGEVLRSILAGICIFLFFTCKKSLLGVIGNMKLFKFLADSSFGIYLIHFFLLGYFNDYQGAQYFLVVLGASTGLAILMHALFEIPVEKLIFYLLKKRGRKVNKF